MRAHGLVGLAKKSNKFGVPCAKQLDTGLVSKVVSGTLEGDTHLQLAKGKIRNTATH